METFQRGSRRASCSLRRFFRRQPQEERAACDKVEALADSNQWNKTAEAIKKIQADWKEIGPVPQKHAKAIWHRFRTPCDQFFKRRKEQLDRLKQERDSNSKKKIQLCEQVEALADSTDWDETAKRIKQLQAEWKQVGPVPTRNPRRSGTDSARPAITSSTDASVAARSTSKRSSKESGYLREARGSSRLCSGRRCAARRSGRPTSSRGMGGVGGYGTATTRANRATRCPAPEIV